MSFSVIPVDRAFDNPANPPVLNAANASLAFIIFLLNNKIFELMPSKSLDTLNIELDYNICLK